VQECRFSEPCRDLHHRGTLSASVTDARPSCRPFFIRGVDARIFSTRSIIRPSARFAGSRSGGAAASYRRVLINFLHRVITLKFPPPSGRCAGMSNSAIPGRSSSRLDQPEGRGAFDAPPPRLWAAQPDPRSPAARQDRAPPRSCSCRRWSCPRWPSACRCCRSSISSRRLSSANAGARHNTSKKEEKKKICVPGVHPHVGRIVHSSIRRCRLPRSASAPALVHVFDASPCPLIPARARRGCFVASCPRSKCFPVFRFPRRCAHSRCCPIKLWGDPRGSLDVPSPPCPASSSS